MQTSTSIPRSFILFFGLPLASAFPRQAGRAPRVLGENSFISHWSPSVGAWVSAFSWARHTKPSGGQLPKIMTWSAVLILPNLYVPYTFTIFWFLSFEVGWGRRQ